MICYEFKGGSGTALRLLELCGSSFTVGAFVQANFGRRHQLTIAGVLVGQHLPVPESDMEEHGSVIGVIATEIPRLPHQLKRLARRCGFGIGRSGSIAAHDSGDLFLASSTANVQTFGDDGIQNLEALAEESLNPAFEAAVQAVDEAVINALVANETIVGRDDRRIPALPREQLKRYGRLHAERDDG